jgi:hypothetical protein
MNRVQSLQLLRLGMGEEQRRRRKIYSYSTILYRDPGRLRLSQGAGLFGVIF